MTGGGDGKTKAPTLPNDSFLMAKIAISVSEVIRRPLLVRGHQAARHPVSVSRFPVSVSGSLESGLRDPGSGLRKPGILFSCYC